jgi:acyl dehydratase
MTDVRFPNPVFAGDTIRAKTTVLESRASKSRPGAGIITFHHQGFNQRNEEVATLTRQALMLRKAQPCKCARCSLFRPTANASWKNP